MWPSYSPNLSSLDYHICSVSRGSPTELYTIQQILLEKQLEWLSRKFTGMMLEVLAQFSRVGLEKSLPQPKATVCHVMLQDLFYSTM